MGWDGFVHSTRLLFLGTFSVPGPELGAGGSVVVWEAQGFLEAPTILQARHELGLVWISWC